MEEKSLMYFYSKLFAYELQADVDLLVFSGLFTFCAFCVLFVMFANSL